MVAPCVSREHWHKKWGHEGQKMHPRHCSPGCVWYYTGLLLQRGVSLRSTDAAPSNTAVMDARVGSHGYEGN